MRRIARAAACVAVLAALVSCGEGGPSRGDVVAALADDEAVPAFGRFALAADALASTTVAVCAEHTSAALDRVRIQVRATRVAWRGLAGFARGPLDAARSWARVDYPIVAAEIEMLLADRSRGPIDEAFVARSVAASTRGLGAIEYLVVDGSTPALEALADARRCALLTASAAVVATEAAALRRAWETDDGSGESYRDQLAGSTTMMTASESIDELVNNAVSKLETLDRVELGAALGGNTDALAEGPAGLGVDDVRARLASLRSVLVGAAGDGGLAPLLGDDLAGRLAVGFDDASAACDPMTGALREALASQRPAVEELQRRVEALRVLVSTEVVSRLGVTVGFSDNDGDSAG